MSTSEEFNQTHGEQGYQITIPYLVDDEIIKQTLNQE